MSAKPGPDLQAAIARHGHGTGRAKAENIYINHRDMKFRRVTAAPDSRDVSSPAAENG
jgi:hypothetical protein